MKRVLVLLVSCVILLSGTVYAVELPDTSRVEGAFLYEATTDTVLYEKNADVQMIPASVTKVMTALVVLDQNPDLSGYLTVSQEAINNTTVMSTGHLEVGETVSVLDCMTYMLVCSANEAANALAVHVGGTTEKFVEMMNEKAQELGMTNSQFLDPFGVGVWEHYMSPRDVCTMSIYAMQNELFREIVGKTVDVLPPTNMRTQGMTYRTTNAIMYPRDREYYQNQHAEYMKGVKTGSIKTVGYNFAGCMERDGLEFYSVAMDGYLVTMPDGKEYRTNFLDTINMLDYAVQFAGTSCKADEPLKTLKVKGGTEDSLEVCVEKNFGLLYLKGNTAEIILDCPDEIKAPVQKGQVIGSVTVRSSDGQERTEALMAMSDVQADASAIVYIGGGVAFAAAMAVIFAVLRRKKPENGAA